MKCKKCGAENEDYSKFCKKCGEPLKSLPLINKAKYKHQKIIIALIIIIILLLVIGGVIAVINWTNIPLETKDFGAFKLDIPVGSDFKLDLSVTTDSNNLFVGYLNKGEYASDVGAFQVGNNITEDAISQMGNLIETDEDIKVYQNESVYLVFRDIGSSQIILFGTNLDALKKVAKSYKEDNINELASPSSSPQQPSSGTESSGSSSPSSITILGGSFSTGSAEEDKTYAKINVGSQHAGESLIVQILYSRDGNALNNGNMVPVTVHSDGYIEVASAEAYHYYPDYATIKIYDSNNNLLTTKSVSLSPTSGTQTF